MFTNDYSFRDMYPQLEQNKFLRYGTEAISTFSFRALSPNFIS